MSQKVILLMGLMASGKSSVVAQLVTAPDAPRYMILSRDERGGKVRGLLPQFQQELADGHSVILDNTFLTVESRKPFIEAAQEAGVPVECHWLQTDIVDCQFNALKRMMDRWGRIFWVNDDIKAHDEAKKDPHTFPLLALFAAKRRLHGDKKKGVPSGKPTMAEGFSKIVKVPFERRPSKGLNKALILDYDGTLRDDARNHGGELPYPTNVLEVHGLPGRQAVLQDYKAKGYLLLGVSNQSGIGKGLVSEETVIACMAETNRQVTGNANGIDFHFCPHHNFPVSCYCRKPQAGIGVWLIRQHDLDPSQCIFVGDMTSDRTFAARCGFQYVNADEFFRGS